MLSLRDLFQTVFEMKKKESEDKRKEGQKAETLDLKKVLITSWCGPACVQTARH